MKDVPSVLLAALIVHDDGDDFVEPHATVDLYHDDCCVFHCRCREHPEVIKQS